MPGIVACVHPRAAEEGAKILEAGGNAFDAALATAFVQMIVTPFSCGIGGMVSAHILSRDHNTHAVVDGCLRAGSRVTPDMWVADYRGEGEFSGESLFDDFRSTMGYTSICTPGAVAALGEVQRRFCTMPWRDLLQPAIRIARQGFPVLPGMTQVSVEQPEPYKPSRIERLNATPDCAALYLRPDGSPFLPDDRLRNPAYADTLEQLAARGADDFYHGELAERVSADLAANGSFVTRDDLAAYEPVTYAPRAATYRDYTVYSNGAPGGGPLLLEALNVLAGFDLAGLGHGSAEYFAHLGSTLQLVNQDRRDYLGDPDFLPRRAPESVLLSPERTAATPRGGRGRYRRWRRAAPRAWGYDSPHRGGCGRQHRMHYPQQRQLLRRYYPRHGVRLQQRHESLRSPSGPRQFLCPAQGAAAPDDAGHCDARGQARHGLGRAGRQRHPERPRAGVHQCGRFRHERHGSGGSAAHPR